MNDEDFDDFDDDDEALPVLTPEGVPIAGTEAKPKRRRRPRGSDVGGGRHGNTKTADLDAARSRTIADAQGKTSFADPEGDDWREQLGNKDRGKAASTLTSGKLTHNSGSGFGLA
jgi:hypothetical protein